MFLEYPIAWHGSKLVAMLKSLGCVAMAAAENKFYQSWDGRQGAELKKMRLAAHIALSSRETEYIEALQRYGIQFSTHVLQLPNN